MGMLQSFGAKGYVLAAKQVQLKSCFSKHSSW
jgi:hypothetical protein